MATSKYYKTTIHDEEHPHSASTRNHSSDVEARLVTQTAVRGQDRIRHIGQVFTTSERPVLHGIAVNIDSSGTDASKQWGMYTLDGITLRDILNELKSGKNESDVPHGSAYDRIHIVMHAADAITYANEHDILHHDLNPDNIIINMRGDIAVIERNNVASAVALEANEHNIDPTYYSPEQARGEANNNLSDVYSLGVVLFEVLALRPPVEADDRKTLWELKRQATLRYFTDDELKHIHPAMHAIVRKALDPNPNLRYACADALRSDLDNFFTDRRVFAYNAEPLAARLIRNLRHHTGTWALSTLALFLCVMLTAFIVQKLRQETTDWQLVLDENFDNYTLQQINEQWTMHHWPHWYPELEQAIDLKDTNIIQLMDGALFIDTSKRKMSPYNLTWKRHLPGDLRVSWDCTPMQDHTNLNCYIGGSNRWNSYMFHLAAHGEDLHCLLTREMETLVTGHLEKAFQIGKNYAFRMEKEGSHIRLFINEQLFMQVEDIITLRGIKHQQFGFEQTANRLRIDNLKVWVQPLPERTDRIEVAHALADNGSLDAAIIYYQNLIDADPTSETAGRARYHSGLCLQKLGRHTQAIEQLQQFTTNFSRHPLRLYACSALARSWLALDNITAVEQQLSIIAENKQAPELLKMFCLRLIAAHYSSDHDLRNLSRQTGGVETARTVLQQVQTWEKKLGISSENISQVRSCLNTLHTLGYYQEIVDNYPSYETSCGMALIAMHRPEEALQRYGHINKVALRALIALGKYAEYLKRASTHSPDYVNSLLALSRYNTIRSLPTYNNRVEAQIHIMSENYEKALLYDPENVDALLALNMLDQIPDLHETIKHNAAYEEVMMRRGLTREVLERNRSNTHSFFHACLLYSIELIEAGAAQDVQHWLQRIRKQPYEVHGRNIERLVMPCMIEYILSGDKQLIDRQALQLKESETQRYVPAVAMFDFIINGDTYSPYHTSIPNQKQEAWTQALLLAFHYEYVNDHPAALRQYLETRNLLPPQQAIVFSRFADWRIKALR